MCWASTKVPQRLIAEKDVTTYKVIGGYGNQHFRSPFMNTKIEFNKVLHEQFFDTEGFETTKTFVENAFFPGTYLENAVTAVTIYQKNKGFHSYSNKNRAFLAKSSDSKRLYLVKCIIPNGAAYYANDEGEIVSESLIITKDKISFNQIAKNSEKLRIFLDNLKN